MSEKVKLELRLLLPEGEECESCLERLQRRLEAHRAVEVAHVDRDGDVPRLCIHYDPGSVSLEVVQSLAIEEGARLESQYRHERLPVEGLDCADCARTLESGVARLDGVLWASVNFAAATLAVEYDAERVDRAAIVARIQALGYDVPAEQRPAEMVFHVEGLDCADCALHLEEALRRTPGVSQVRVDFTLARLRVCPARTVTSCLPRWPRWPKRWATRCGQRRKHKPRPPRPRAGGNGSGGGGAS